MTSYTEQFWDSVKCSREYAEALDLVRWNSEGKVWVTGGFVYKTLARVMHRVEIVVRDIDFIIETLPSPVIPVNGWKQETNKYGGLRFRHGAHTVDITCLDKINSIVRRGLKPSFEHYLSGVPLNVQSIAYDLDKNAVVGKIGITALEMRIVEINNVEEAQVSAQKKEISVPELVQRTARVLNFTPII